MEEDVSKESHPNKEIDPKNKHSTDVKEPESPTSPPVLSRGKNADTDRNGNRLAEGYLEEIVYRKYYASHKGEVFPRR